MRKDVVKIHCQVQVHNPFESLNSRWRRISRLHHTHTHKQAQVNPGMESSSCARSNKWAGTTLHCRLNLQAKLIELHRVVSVA